MKSYKWDQSIKIAEKYCIPISTYIIHIKFKTLRTKERKKNEKIFLWIESLRLEFLKLGHLRLVGIQPEYLTEWVIARTGWPSQKISDLIQFSWIFSLFLRPETFSTRFIWWWSLKFFRTSFGGKFKSTSYATTSFRTWFRKSFQCGIFYQQCQCHHQRPSEYFFLHRY